MGFFYDNVQRPAATAQQRRTIKLQSHAQHLNCAHCSLDRAQLAHPKILPTGTVRPIIYFLGEAPGQTEDERGEQFVGVSGQFLRDLIPEEWIDRIRWNNTIRCHPPDNREPSGLEVSCCRRLQVADIEATRPQAIVGFGGVPLEWALGPGRQISVCRGRRVPIKIGSHTCWFYPITDPEDVLRLLNDKKKGRAIECTFQRDLARVFNDASVGFPEAVVEPENVRREGIVCWTEYGQAGLQMIEDVLHGMRDEDHGHDIETNGLRPYKNDFKILTVAVGTYDSTFAFPWQHREARWTPKEYVRLKEIFLHYLLGNGKKWCHSFRFEGEWWARVFGPRVLYEGAWGDTLGQAHIIDSRKIGSGKDDRTGGASLDELIQLWFGFRLKDENDIDRTKMEQYPLSMILPYNGMDTKYTHSLSIVQAQRLEEMGLTHVYELMHAATPALIMLQRRGVVRNVPVIQELDKQLAVTEAEVQQRIMSDGDVAEFLKAGNAFSPTSNVNVTAFFRDFLRFEHPGKIRNGGAWGSGSSEKNRAPNKYNVDEGVLSQFDHPVARGILDLRDVIKIHGYITPLLPGGKYVHDDELVHTSISQYITVSGRTASSDPNTQNYPRRDHKEIRRSIMAPPGYKFAAFDFGQLEWRIGAMASRDRFMSLELFDPKADIHGEWTDSIGGKFVPAKVKKNRKKVRDSIKQYWTFANLYGNEPSGIAWDLSKEFGIRIDTSDIEPFYAQYWNKYPALKQYQDELMRLYWEHGYVETLTGQRRYEPCAKNEIINHPFQGTAGHLVLAAQTRITAEAVALGKEWLVPIMNIHDDLSFYLPEKSLEEDIEWIAKHMCAPAFDFVTVPLTVECSLGDNWADKEEIATFRTTDFYEMEMPV